MFWNCWNVLNEEVSVGFVVVVLLFVVVASSKNELSLDLF